MSEQPHQPQRHSRWGFAIGEFTPPPGSTPRAATRRDENVPAPARPGPPGFVACAPLLTAGFILSVVAYVLLRIGGHESVVYSATNGASGSIGTTLIVLSTIAGIVGAVLLATGICFLGRHVDTLTRAHLAAQRQQGTSPPTG